MMDKLDLLGVVGLALDWFGHVDDNNHSGMPVYAKQELWFEKK